MSRGEKLEGFSNKPKSWLTPVFKPPGRISEYLQWDCKPSGRISESLQWDCKPPGRISESLQWNFKPPERIFESLLKLKCLR